MLRDWNILLCGAIQCEPSKLFNEKYTFNGILQHFKIANIMFVGAKLLVLCAFAFYIFIAFIPLIVSYCVKFEIVTPAVRKCAEMIQNVVGKIYMHLSYHN